MAEGFAIVPRSVIDAELDPLEFRVMVQLLDQADSDGKCWPSREHIAKKAVMSVRSVGRQITKLTDRKMIAVCNRKCGQNPRSNLYQILEPFWQTGLTVPPKRTESPAKEDSESLLKRTERPTNKNHRTRTKNKNQKNKGDFEIPDSLNREPFLSKWSEYQQHRVELKKKLTPTSAKAALKKLEAMGSDKAVQALSNSISNGWQGIFEPTSTISKTKDDTRRKREDACRYDPTLG